MWDVRVFDRAYQPFQPLKPKPVQNTVFGAIIGLVLGIGLSMIFEYFDDSFHSINEVEEFLGLPVLAAIPKMDK
jgi:capsular polysaccharide biosynthesis protein